MTTKTGSIHSIGLVMVPTDDQDRSIEFYERLGFEKRTDVEFGGGAYRWVEVYPPAGRTGLALAPPPGGQAVQPKDIGVTLTTSDADASHAELRSLGVDVDAEISRMGDPVPPMFWFRDPEGHSLMIVEVPEADCA